MAAGQAPPVTEWPANAFHQVLATMRVFTNMAIDQAFGADPAREMFDPPGATGADAEVV